MFCKWLHNVIHQWGLAFFKDKGNPTVDIRYNMIMEIDVWLLNKKQVSQTAF